MDEPIIVIAHAQELLNMFDACQCRPVNDSLHLAWVHTHLPMPHDMAQVFDLRPTELAFGALNTELMLEHAGKHGT